MDESKKLLLLIEDNPLLTGMYQAAFEKAGFSIIVAHDGATGLALAKEKKPTGVILDLYMPGTNGFEVLTTLSGDESLKTMKAIVLTSSTTPGDKERATRLGAADFLVKSELTLASIVSRAAEHFSS